jgi:hypothetical protein
VKASHYRVWLTNSQARPIWGNVKVIHSSYFAADGIDVTVEGEGSDLKKLVADRNDIFVSCRERPANEPDKI